MKFKFNLILCFCVFAQLIVNAQWQNSGTYIYTPSVNKVGIGMATPAKKFEIWDGATGRFSFSAASCSSGYEVSNTIDNDGYRINIGSAIRDYYTSINGKDRLTILCDGGVGINCDPGQTTLKVYQLENPLFEVASNKGRFQILSATCDNCGAVGSKIGDAVLRQMGDTHNILLSMPNDNNDGRTYIGINDMANGTWCKFFNNRTMRVDGVIYAKEINVQTNVWADTVFSANYKLKSLDEIDTYIKNNNHLPNIPSEKEVKENGINLAQMNTLLLQKIEEITLLMIEQDKMIKDLQYKVNKLGE